MKKDSSLTAIVNRFKCILIFINKWKYSNMKNVRTDLFVSTVWTNDGSNYGLINSIYKIRLFDNSHCKDQKTKLSQKRNLKEIAS